MERAFQNHKTDTFIDYDPYYSELHIFILNIAKIFYVRRKLMAPALFINYKSTYIELFLWWQFWIMNETKRLSGKH